MKQERNFKIKDSECCKYIPSCLWIFYKKNIGAIKDENVYEKVVVVQEETLYILYAVYELIGRKFICLYKID